MISESETETCPHCRSEGVAADATHCPHCGQRIEPRFTRATAFLVVALLVAVLAVTMVVRAQDKANRDASRQTECIVSSVDPSTC